MNGESSNGNLRIESLLKRHFPKQIKPALFDLRYQLLYSAPGCLDVKENGHKVDISVLLILVFHTDLYDEIKGLDNCRDYLQYVHALENETIDMKKNIDARKLLISGQELYAVYANVRNSSGKKSRNQLKAT
ncbi:MAG: hypothetical protein MI784_13495 [Cytophagales bacterium]|nr:hypothetical protein [Cytophagales bacterium]